jgi:hypothetical protein
MQLAPRLNSIPYCSYLEKKRLTKTDLVPPEITHAVNEIPALRLK